MSLVVSAIQDGHISAAADTKVTFELDEAATRRTYFEALPKIVILRPGVMASVTGPDPKGLIRTLVENRSAPVAELLDMVINHHPDAGAVIATNAPQELWVAKFGKAQKAAGTGWSGDRAAFEIFQQQRDNWRKANGRDSGVPPLPFHPLDMELMTSLQFLTTFNLIDSVGGFTITATTTPNGFRLLDGMGRVMEPMWDEESPIAVSHDVYFRGGTGDTFGAVGIFLEQTTVGMLFVHDQPWEGVRVPARSLAEFRSKALSEHGQTLS